MLRFERMRDPLASDSGQSSNECPPPPPLAFPDPANPQVSRRAKIRGLPQLGTLGAGNHYAEIQVVEEIFDQQAAKKMGIDKVNQVCGLLAFRCWLFGGCLPLAGHVVTQISECLFSRVCTLCTPCGGRRSTPRFEPAGLVLLPLT